MKTSTTLAMCFLFLVLVACSRAPAPAANDTVVAPSPASAQPGAVLVDPPPPPPKPVDTPVAPKAEPVPQLKDRPSSPGARAASQNAGMSAGGAGSFDGPAAARALAAVDLSGCGATPGSSGRVAVTFLPDGRATSEITSGGGRSSDACLRARFDAVRIPSFVGPAVTTPHEFHIPGA